MVGSRRSGWVLKLAVWEWDRCIHPRRRGVGEEAGDGGTRDDLNQMTGFDMMDLDKGRLESNDIGVLQRYHRSHEPRPDMQMNTHQKRLGRLPI